MVKQDHTTPARSGSGCDSRCLHCLSADFTRGHGFRGHGGTGSHDVRNVEFRVRLPVSPFGSHGDVVNPASHDPCKVEYRVQAPTSPNTCGLSSREEHECAILEARVRVPQAAYRLVVEKLSRRSDKAEKVERYHPSRSPRVGVGSDTRVCGTRVPSATLGPGIHEPSPHRRFG